MKGKTNQFVLVPLLALGVSLLAIGCQTSKESKAEPKEERVTVEQLSAPARATVDKVTAGGHVDQIDKEVERGLITDKLIRICFLRARMYSTLRG